MPDAPGTIVQRFAAWARVRGLSQAQAAKLAGMSAATFSQVVSGTYAGNTERYVQKMERALAHADRRERAPRRPEIADTSVCQEVVATLRVAHDEGVMAVVMGVAGCGKTCGVSVYCRAEPETISLIMRPSGRRGSQGAGKPLLNRLAAAVGIELPRGTSIYDSVELIGQALKGSDRLVVIDEIDYAAEDVLQCIRMIHDIAQCGIVLIATPAFLEKLRRMNSSTVNQFLSRIAHRCDVGGMTEEDAEKILTAQGLDKITLSAARAGAKGSPRRLVHGILGAQRIVRDEGGKLDAKTISRAYEQLWEV